MRSTVRCCNVKGLLHPAYLNDTALQLRKVLSSEKNKSKSEVVRELLTKAVDEEKRAYWLDKYGRREVTLRKLAKELNLPLWKVIEL